MMQDNTAWVERGDGKFQRESIVNIDLAEELDTATDKAMERFDPQTERERKMVLQFVAFHQEVLEREFKFEQSRVLIETLRLIRKIFGIMVVRQNPLLQTYGIAFATGLDFLNGISMTEAAKKCSVTRAAVSKSAKEWQRVLNFPPSRHMKSEEACKSYSKTQTENHWRHRSSMASIFKSEGEKHEKSRVKNGNK